VVVKRIRDRIITLKFVVEKRYLNVIRAYAPQVGIKEHLKVKFWEELKGSNGHVGISMGM